MEREPGSVAGVSASILYVLGVSFSASWNHLQQPILEGRPFCDPCYQPCDGPCHCVFQLPLLVLVPLENGPSLKGSLLALSTGPVNSIASLSGGEAAGGKNPKANAPQKCHQ